MKIGILGSGVVGKSLSTAFLKEGHEVMMGTRDLNKADTLEWKNQNAGGQTGAYAEAAAFGELLVLATKGKINPDVIKQAGEHHFTGKTIIDVSIPLEDVEPLNGVMPYYTGPNESQLEKLRQFFRSQSGKSIQQRGQRIHVPTGFSWSHPHYVYL